MIGLGLNEEERIKKDDWHDEKAGQEPDFVLTPYTPPSSEESIRQSGLAYAAGISFFGSVVFMLFLGWGADLLFGSSPWGLVAGIVLGAIIGFVQLFRITSRIFDRKMGEPSVRSLISSDEDDDT